MKEGVFILGKLIKNPKPDRRVKDDWIAATEWKPGNRFMLRLAPWLTRNHGVAEPFELSSLDNRYGACVNLDLADGELQVVTAHEALVPVIRELVQALRPSEDPDDAVSYVFVSRGYVGEERSVLCRLVRNGVLSVDLIKAAIKAQDAEDAARIP